MHLDLSPRWLCPPVACTLWSPCSWVVSLGVSSCWVQFCPSCFCLLPGTAGSQIASLLLGWPSLWWVQHLSSDLVYLRQLPSLFSFFPYFCHPPSLPGLPSFQSLLEMVFGVKVVITGDGFIPGERSVIIMNHRTRLDWMFLWCCLLRYSYLRLEKICLKAALKAVPGFGGCPGLSFTLFSHPVRWLRWFMFTLVKSWCKVSWLDFGTWKVRGQDDYISAQKSLH